VDAHRQKKSPGLVPAAGVAAQDIDDARRFGQAIAGRFRQSDRPIDRPMFKGLSAVRLNPNIIASERIGLRSFRIWGRLLRRLGPAHSLRRRAGLAVYILFLIIMICTVVPLNYLVNKGLHPFASANSLFKKSTMPNHPVNKESI